MNLQTCSRCGARESYDTPLKAMSRIVAGEVLDGPWFCTDRKACTARRLAQKPATFTERHDALIAQRQLRLVR